MAKSSKREIEQYEHSDKTLVNNPPVGLVTPATDPEPGEKQKTYQYDPHLDSQLVWEGKAEHTSCEVPMVSRADRPAVDRRCGTKAKRRAGARARNAAVAVRGAGGKPAATAGGRILQACPRLDEWLVAGDSLLVMNSLLEKEGMAKV
jgi:adenine-specific DNA-methyltransferase